jgi:hypothetical protein
MRIVTESLRMLQRFGQNFGPYLVLEILLPGGTLLALLLFMYRRRKVRIGGASFGRRRLFAVEYALDWNRRPLSISGSAERL